MWAPTPQIIRTQNQGSQPFSPRGNSAPSQLLTICPRVQAPFPILLSLRLKVRDPILNPSSYRGAWVQVP